METVGSKISPLVLNPGKIFTLVGGFSFFQLRNICIYTYLLRPHYADQSTTVLPGKKFNYVDY